LSILRNSSYSVSAANVASYLVSKFLTISYLRHIAIKIPGITISPSPSRLNYGGVVDQSLGKSNLMGASILFATVSITSVPKTKKMS